MRTDLLWDDVDKVSLSNLAGLALRIQPGGGDTATYPPDRRARRSESAEMSPGLWGVECGEKLDQGLVAVGASAQAGVRL